MTFSTGRMRSIIFHSRLYLLCIRLFLPDKNTSMKFPHPLSVREIADLYQAEILGDAAAMVTGMNEIHHVEQGDITFVDVKKYVGKALASAASFVLLNERVSPPPGKTLLLCERPFEVYNALALRFRPVEALQTSVHPTARIHPSAILEPHVVVGPYVEIGADCHIHANVTIEEHTWIGERVVIQSGAVIGTEAFYYKRTPEGYTKWRSTGRVVLEADVEVGAQCTINKGVSSDTRIGAGTKLDCHVHVGHDVVVGKRCLLVAGVAIAGNNRIGDDVILYGQVGVAQNLHIGDRATVLAQSGVGTDLEGGKTYFGTPAQEARQEMRQIAIIRKLPAHWARLEKGGDTPQE